MQPIILTHLTSQLNELIRLLQYVLKYKNEFKVSPVVVINVPFTNPTVGQLKTYILDTHPTFYGLDFRLVHDNYLEYIKTNFTNYYIIYQDSEVFPQESCYKWIDENITDVEAILFYWQNPILPSNCWHTDMYVTKTDKYIPHRGINTEFDCLQVAWGKYLVENNLNGFLGSHNSRDRKFKREALEICPNYLDIIKNYRDDYQESIFKRFFKWLKS